MRAILEEECKIFRTLASIKKKGPLEKKLLPLASKLLLTPPFEVLKKRKQLGFLDKIMKEWHHPRHSRFDHTVGVMAKCMVASDRINKNTTDSGYEGQLELLDVAELVAAAAIHDSGHLPLSHVTERAILAHHGNRYGARHEERVVPMLLNGHEFFTEFLDVFNSWDLWGGDNEKFQNSIFRIAYLLDPATSLQQLDNKDHRCLRGYVRPKRAIEQLITSELDMDRLDYLIRDSDNLKYEPVSRLKTSIADMINGMFLYKAENIGDTKPVENLELCIKKDYLENVFFMLVGRVLLYKYRYFDKEVRRFEGALTYLLSELLGNGASIQTIELMQLGDKEFLNTTLGHIINKTYFDDDNEKTKLINLLTNLQRSNSNRYEYVGSIDRDKIENPRLKEEFAQKAESFHYIKQLQSWLSDEAKVGQDCLLLDAFSLKPGEGKFLVQAPKKADNKSSEPQYEVKLLKDYMNGSNLHRLCSQLSLDVYIHTEESETAKASLLEQINLFGKLEEGAKQQKPIY